MKKLLALLTAAVLLCSAVPMFFVAADDDVLNAQDYADVETEVAYTVQKNKFMPELDDIWENNLFYVKSDKSAVSVDEVDYVEFDTYLDEGTCMKMWIGSTAGTGTSAEKRGRVNFGYASTYSLSAKKGEGWYHFRIPANYNATNSNGIDGFNGSSGGGSGETKITYIMVEINQNSTKTNHNNYIKNLSLTKVKEAEAEEELVTEVIYSVIKDQVMPFMNNGGEDAWGEGQNVFYVKEDKSAVSLDEIDYVEFDTYLDEGTNMKMWIGSTEGIGDENVPEKRGRANFGYSSVYPLSAADGEGWYHFRIPANYTAADNNGIDGFNGSAGNGKNETTIRYIMIEVNQNSAKTNHTNYVKNVALTKIKPPEDEITYEVVYTVKEEQFIPGMNGTGPEAWTEGENVFYVKEDKSAVSLDEVDYVEFDAYLAEGTAEKVWIGSTAGTGEGVEKRGRAYFSYKANATNGEGWYHFRIPANYTAANGTDLDGFDGSAGNGRNETTIRFLLFETGNGARPEGTLNYIKNVVLTKAVKKQQIAYETVYTVISDQVMPLMNNGGEDAWGEGQNVFYVKEDKSAVSLDEIDYVEFDTYLDEGTCMKMWIGSTEGIGDEDVPEKRGRANFGYSSVYPLSAADGEGWYHFRIPANYTAADNNGIDGFNGSAGNGKNETTIRYIMIEVNQNSAKTNHTNYVKNLVLTKEVTVNSGGNKDEDEKNEIPADGDKPSTPDKSAVYISTADGKTDDNGAWDPSTATKNTTYKTEGTASISQKLDYTVSADGGFKYITYLLDTTVDVSDISKLKFDLFVDLPELFGKQGNKFTVLLSSNRTGTGKTASWELDISKLVAGWNSFELDINEAAKSSGLDLSSIKAFIFRFDELKLEKPEQFNWGIDNLRYLSKTGNTVLKVEKDESDDGDSGVTGDTGTSDSGTYNDYNNGNLYYQNDDTAKNDEVFTETTVVKGKPTVKTINTVTNIEETNYLMLAVILGSEAAVVAAAVVLFIIFYKKKMRAS